MPKIVRRGSQLSTAPSMVKKTDQLAKPEVAKPRIGSEMLDEPGCGRQETTSFERMRLQSISSKHRVWAALGMHHQLRHQGGGMIIFIMLSAIHLRCWKSLTEVYRKLMIDMEA